MGLTSGWLISYQGNQQLGQVPPSPSGEPPAQGKLFSFNKLAVGAIPARGLESLAGAEDKLVPVNRDWLIRECTKSKRTTILSGLTITLSHIPCMTLTVLTNPLLRYPSLEPISSCALQPNTANATRQHKLEYQESKKEDKLQSPMACQVTFHGVPENRISLWFQQSNSVSQ